MRLKQGIRYIVKRGNDTFQTKKPHPSPRRPEWGARPAPLVSLLPVVVYDTPTKSSIKNLYVSFIGKADPYVPSYVA